MKKTTLTAFATMAAMVFSCVAQAAESKHVSFITCPIFRDTESRCWLAERGNVTYYIGRTGAGTSPQLLHKILIEGTISDEPPSCGGVVIKPIQISVFPEIDYSCNTVLPDNGDRPTERVFYDLPPAEQLLIDEPMPIPQGPFTDQKFVGHFDYDSSFLNIRLQGVIETTANYAIASKASHVKIIGRIGHSKLDDGRILVERTTLAKVRAQAVAAALTGLGVDPGRLEVTWLEDTPPPDGIHDADRRAVEIALTVPQAK